MHDSYILYLEHRIKKLEEQVSTLFRLISQREKILPFCFGKNMSHDICRRNCELADLCYAEESKKPKCFGHPLWNKRENCTDCNYKKECHTLF